MLSDALGCQASYGRTSCVQLLLDAQADLSATDADGDTALDNAWKAGRQDVVEAIRREEQRRSTAGDVSE